MKSRPSGTTRSAAATLGDSFGTTVSGAAAPASRLRTMTQRQNDITVSPRWFRPVDRTQTTPVLPLEFSFSPITSLVAVSVSPGMTGRRNRASA